jgi:hypothetical protein
MILAQTAKGQVVMNDDVAVQTLGQVGVGSHKIGVLVSYSGDTAFLVMSVEDAQGKVGYAPLYASTYRGVPAVDLDILASAAGDAVWVNSSWAGSETVAYLKLGATTVLTPFGEMALLQSPEPTALSGGPSAFPAIDPDDVTRRATFYLPDL